LAAVLVGGAIAEQLYEAATGAWSVQQSLPLHLCDIGIFVTAIALVGIGGACGRCSGRPRRRVAPPRLGERLVVPDADAGAVRVRRASRAATAAPTATRHACSSGGARKSPMTTNPFVRYDVSRSGVIAVLKWPPRLQRMSDAARSSASL
jgi:hypothetical protein